MRTTTWRSSTRAKPWRCITPSGLASPAQRIVLYAKDRGCSFPGCTVPGYLCEVHHNDPYALHPVTDVNDLTFACGTQPQTRRTRLDHPQKRTTATPNGSRRRTSTTARPRANAYHHPEKLLRDDDEIP